jgi:hypothetical protein
MHRTILAFALAGAAGAFIAAPASAVTCYRLIDRNDNVVYQDIYPPVDLSDDGAAERKVLRSRGEHMIAMEVDRCPTLHFLMGDAGGQRLDFDQTSDETVPRAAKAKDASRGAAPPKRSAAATSAPAKPASSAKPVDKREATQN